MGLFSKKATPASPPSHNPVYNPAAYTSPQPLVMPQAPVVVRQMPSIIDQGPLPSGVADEINQEMLSPQSLSQLLQMREEEYTNLEVEHRELRDLLEQVVDRIPVDNSEMMALVVALNQKLIESHANESIARSRITSETTKMQVAELRRLAQAG